MRVVLDTNTVVSTLLFKHGRLAWIREFWTAARFVPLVSSATARELIRVLAYPKFGLEEAEIAALLSAYLPFAEAVTGTDQQIEALPTCRDPDDQMFLQLAAAGDADVLVTGDPDLLELAAGTVFSIETPAVFRQRFE